MGEEKQTRRSDMVGFTRVGRITSDPQSAMAFAIDMTNFIKKKYEADITCWARLGGPTGQIVWQTAYADMTAFEKLSQALLADQEYWEKVKDAEGLFETASFEDGLWNQIA
jgi:hypothetical protein